MMIEDLGFFLSMVSTYSRAVFQEEGFVEVKKSDVEECLLNVVIHINNLGSKWTDDEIKENIELFESFVYDERRHPLYVLTILNIQFEVLK